MPTRSGRRNGGPNQPGWLARQYAKKGRNGKTVWTAYYLGVYPTWEEARIAEIDSKIDALQHEREGLVRSLPLSDSPETARPVPPPERALEATRENQDGDDRTPS